MLIGHYQCRCIQGDVEANLRVVEHGLALAAEAGLRILSLPECFLTGYFGTEAAARRNAFAVDSPEMARVLQRTASFSSLWLAGFNELREGRLYNTIAVVEGGRILGTYSKAFPCFSYFEPGRAFPVFEVDGLTVGVVICADGGYVEPTRILALKGARLVFAPHFNSVADPLEHYRMVHNDHVARAVENGVYFLRGNNVVAKEDVGDDPGRPRVGYGDSHLIDPDGEVVAAAGVFDEYLMVYNLDLSRTYRAQTGGRSRSRQSALALGETLLETAQADA